MIGNKNKNKSWMIKILAMAIIVFFNGTVFGGVVMADDYSDCLDSQRTISKSTCSSFKTELLSNCGNDSACAADVILKIDQCTDKLYEDNKSICDTLKPKETTGTTSTTTPVCGNGVPEPGEECDDKEGQGDDVDKYINPSAPEKDRQLDSCFQCKYVDVPYEFNVTKYLKIPEGQTYLEKSTNPDTSVSLKKGLIYFIITGIEFATKIISAFALLFIIVGGIVLMVSSGNSSLQQKGKRLILYSILGLVIAFMSLIIITSVQSIFYTT
jgi:hypothetical protein